MKKLVFIAIFIGAFTLQAQEYLGTWSFESIDLETMKEMSVSDDQSEIDKKIQSNTNLFVSLKLKFTNDKVYTLSFMGQEQEFPFVENEGVLLLRKEDKLVVLTDDKARLYTADMVLLLKKGDVSVTKTYTYLTEESYETKKIDLKDLIGKWKVEEVRVKEGIEGAELQEMVALMITFNFITDTDMAFGAMGMETVKKYTVDRETNVLSDKDAKSGVEKSTYTIIELNKDHMIVSHNEEGTLLYLVRE